MRGVAIVLFAFFPIVGQGQSQSETTKPLITQQVDSSRTVALTGSLHPLARTEFDKGEAPGDLPMEHVMLVLKRSPQQEAALQTLLQNQQDKASPEYHRWLTPQQFGEQFGPSDDDIQSISNWLESNGFQLGHVSAGRTAIEFSGTAKAIQSAFHTEIRKYLINGQEHWANATSPKIPAALEPAVAGIVSLHNFLSQPQIKTTGQWIAATKQTGAAPQLTFSNGVHALTPADYAVIYNMNPLYQAGINGSGRTIAVLGRSNIKIQDVLDFRSVFGLPSNAPQIVLNGNDPGDLGADEEAEAVLDVSWAGAVAPYATVKFILSASTNTADGVDLSEEYAINNNVADVITESFGDCEANHTQADAIERASLAEQAAAQGITFLVSAGDSGAAGCDSPASYSAVRPASVNILASNPYTVAVGGTGFNENGSSSYWESQNGSGFESARSYVPENVWNSSCSQSVCGVNANLYASGGGRSIFYSKPAWQAGVTGIPSDGARDLPDVALTAAANNDPYLLCLRGSCAANSSGTITFAAVGGTSASAPSFAGILALVNQKTNTRQGQANYVLYQLASGETLSQCNGSYTSGLPSSNCIFNDVTIGTNTVPGGVGYQAGTGYDLASGLGSVNATNLVNQWGSSGGFTQAYYEIVNRGSGKALDVRGESTADGAAVEQWDFWNGPNQQWQLVPVDSVYYRIVSRNSGKVLDVDGVSIANGSGIEQWTYWGGANQQWQLIPTDSGYYRIVSKNSGKVLDVSNQSTSNGANVEQWDFWGGFNQQWQFVPVQ
jgi:subtilase family serine protease